MFKWCLSVFFNFYNFSTPTAECSVVRRPAAYRACPLSRHLTKHLLNYTRLVLFTAAAKIANEQIIIVLSKLSEFN